MIDLWSDDETATVRLWSLTEDALVEDGPDAASFVVLNRWSEIEVDGIDEASAEFLRRMGFGPVSLRNVLPDAAAGGAARSAVESALAALLDRLGCVVVHSLGLPDGQGAMLSLVPVVAEPRFRPWDTPLDRTIRLSRFATMRPVDGVLMLEAPGADYEVMLILPAAQALVTALSATTTVERLSVTTGLSLPVVGALVSFLVAAGVVLQSDETGGIAEDSDPAARGWRHHEVLFHHHSSRRGGAGPSDARYEFADRLRSPALYERPGRRIPLPAVDLAALEPRDVSLTSVLERDHACPHAGGKALSLDRVAELLYRGARARSTGPVALPTLGGVTYRASQRPYFSMACLYELELYLTVNRCDGLERGIYHYSAGGHALVLVDDEPGRVEEMLGRSTVGAGLAEHPAATLTVTARLARTTWLLAGASYAMALMHSGALLEVLYLVGRAVGVAMHVTAADGDHTADELLGLSWPEEVALSECVLGADE